MLQSASGNGNHSADLVGQTFSTGNLGLVHCWRGLITWFGLGLLE